jgi:hypothetical protein
VAEPRLHAQPDPRSCGPASLVVARALLDDAYAVSMAAPEAFRDEVLALHRRVTGWRDARGRIQPPWPRALGTPPWAAARELAALTGTPYVVRFADFDRVAAATAAGPVAVYVGSRWLPRHVVLARDVADGALRVYQPGVGRMVRLDRDAFDGDRAGVTGWPRVWFSVLPAPRTPA